MAENSQQRAQETAEFFLLGLFSLIDAILDKPMEQMMGYYRSPTRSRRRSPA